MTPSPDVTSVLLHASYHDLTVTDRIVIDNPCGDRCGDLLEVVWGSSLRAIRPLSPPALSRIVGEVYVLTTPDMTWC